MIKYIFEYFCLLSNLVTSLIAYKILVSEKMKFNFKNLSLLIILNAVSLLIRYANNGILTLFSNILFIFIVIKLFFSCKNSKIVYYTLVISLISMICDSIISLSVSNYYLLNIKKFQENYFYRILLNIPVCLSIIVVCIIPPIKKMISIFYKKYFSKIKFSFLKIIFVMIITLLFAFIFLIYYYKQVDKIGRIFILSGIFIFIILILFMCYIIYKEHQIAELNKKIIDENNYIKGIVQQDVEFKHNVINNLLGIKTVSNKKTNTLIDELINSYQTEYKTISNINDLPTGIQSIIYKKAYEENIEDINLIVDNNIRSELYDILTPKQYNNLCTAIGIIFDNAIEAIKDIKEKIIYIEIEENKTSICISIKNTFSNIVDIEEIGRKNYTTKTKGHGVGLNYIHKLKTLNYENEIINNMFISKIQIKKV